MRLHVHFVSALITLLVFAGAANAQSTEVVRKHARPYVFAAEIGTTPDILGMGFSKDLAPTDDEGNTHRVFPNEYVEVPADQYQVDVEQVTNQLSLAAHGRFLFVEAGVKFSSSKRYLVGRVAHISKVLKLKSDTKPIGNAPLVASKIYYGWAFYYVIEGDAHTFTADVVASLMTKGGGSSIELQKKGMNYKLRLIGLKPKDKYFIATPEDAESLLDNQVVIETAEDAQPIFVEYTVNEDIAVETIPWARNEFRAGRYRIQVTAQLQNRSASGRDWDVWDAPDPTLEVRVSGAVAKTCNETNTRDVVCADVLADLDDTSSVQIHMHERDSVSSNDVIGDSETLRPFGSGYVPGDKISMKPPAGVATLEIVFVLEKEGVGSDQAESSKSADAAIAELQKLRSRACDCRTKECATATQLEFDKFLARHKDTSGSSEQATKVGGLAGELSKCLANAMNN